MANTGYQIQNGKDLIKIFRPISQGTMYETPTGYLVSNGKDLRQIFAKNVSGTMSTDTGYVTSNIDLRYIFESNFITIAGTGAYTISPLDGNKYKITFTGGTNSITMNDNISSFNVIVVGGGGGGGYGTSNANGRTSSNNSGGGGGGGGGGGFGYVEMAYVSNTTYSISVADPVGQITDGNSSTFKNATTKLGITATGGGAGTVNNSDIRATEGTCTNTGIGTLTARTGGEGGAGASPIGRDSSGSITVLGVSYNYGGGGRAGANNPGSAGLYGVGGNNVVNSADGENGTSPGSGGGGGARQTGSLGGNGGPGLVIITFTYS